VSYEIDPENTVALSAFSINSQTGMIAVSVTKVALTTCLVV